MTERRLGRRRGPQDFLFAGCEKPPFGARRSEQREPDYAQQPKPDTSRPAPVVTRKRSFSGMMGALLGRKRENEE